MRKDDIVGLLLLDNAEQQLLVGVWIVVADLGRIGQIQGAVKRRQGRAAAYQKHRAVGAELGGEPDELLIRAKQLSISMFCYQ